MNLESLITDLAFILLLGAVVTLLFKWIKQPVVLGYIVAGFLASPHFTYLPSVTTEANIDFWAQIGIIVLLFALGLEFSFKKLLNSGGSAVVTALIIVCGMMAAGFGIGRLLHFNTINSLFLGGMLSMSSTTIIIKAFTDMGLMQHKFAPLVMAVLIVEDLFAVVMMVVLSSIAINNSVEGGEMLYSIAKLIFFLVIWFLVGVLVLPSALNRCRRYLNSETLLVVSMGLCLGMAVFSVYCGFSMALGAFVMGSILAGTSYAERIEQVVTPIKDLFGSVFFISVGMMVQPDIIISYWFPILVLSLVVICGMIIFGTFGMLVTGQTLKVAIQSGFSLTQIGEFAFIIASLGMSLGVLDSTIYPIIVAVSVITTFTTPYFIKMSVPCYNLIEKHLPENLHFLINRYQEEASKENATGRAWQTVLKRYLWRTTVYCIILIAIVIIGDKYIMPWMDTVSPRWSHELCTFITLGAMSPFLVALMMPINGSYTKDFKSPLQVNNNIPRVVMTIFRFIIALAFIAYVIGWAYSARAAAGVIAMVFVILVLLFSGKLRGRLRQMETKFFDNLNERELRRSGKKNAVVNDLHQAYMTVGTGCQFVGQRLRDSNLRKLFGVNIVSIQRNQQVIVIPGGDTRIFPGDIISVIGTDEQIVNMLPRVEAEAEVKQQTRVEDVQLMSIMLDEDSPLINKTPRSTSLRDRYTALVVAVSRGDEFIDSNADIVFAPGDIVWLVADSSKIYELKGKNK
jgi:CPA2 family monovalent cation:H+ antiporter-2